MTMANNYPDYYQTRQERAEEKEKELLSVIEKWFLEHQYAPSVKQLTDAIGFRSTSTTHKYLKRLKDKGVLTWREKHVRTLKIKKKAL